MLRKLSFFPHQPLLGGPFRAAESLQAIFAKGAGHPTADFGDLLLRRLTSDNAADNKQISGLEALKEALSKEAEANATVPLSRIAELCRVNGLQADNDSVDLVCAQLHSGNTIVRVGNFIHLQPEKIASTILSVLPMGEDDVRSKLQKIEEELTDLDQKHSELEKIVNRTTNRLLLAGFFVLSLQLVLFIWLTWWELSWDVMEPFSYVISLFYSVVGFMFFLATKGHVFDLGPFKRFWASRTKARIIRDLAFNEDRYHYLQQLQERYRKHLRMSLPRS